MIGFPAIQFQVANIGNGGSVAVASTRQVRGRSDVTSRRGTTCIRFYRREPAASVAEIFSLKCNKSIDVSRILQQPIRWANPGIEIPLEQKRIVGTLSEAT